MGKKNRRGDRAHARHERKIKDQHVEITKQNLINAANASNDVLAPFAPFLRYNRSGMDVELKFYKAEFLSDDLKDFVFNLTKTNMEQMYSNVEGWGWKDTEKRRELFDDGARYVIAHKSAEGSLGHGAPIAFCHFRFILEDDHEVLYLYEFQVEQEFQGKGLGRHLTQLLELVACKLQMKKVMLTVFSHNKAALGFYKTKMRYVLDESSPDQCMDMEDTSEAYEILSKPLVKRS